MDEARLAVPLATLLGAKLASALSREFVKIRQDYATKTLERASPGKFVEVLVQSLQQISNGSFDDKPDVDAYLSKKVENEAKLPEALRICVPRVARSIYTLRNKRNIAHMNEVDPNAVDLAYIHQAAAWITAELVRHASGVSMEQAGALIALIQTPVGALVEEIDGTRIVHANVSMSAEILILLHSHYPDRVQLKDILASMSARSEGGVTNQLRDLRAKKLLHGDNKLGYRLTQPGHNAATQEIRRLQVSAAAS